MVIKNLENKIKLVGIICSAFLMGCIIISVSSIWTARCMVTDAQQKGVCIGRQRAHTGEPHHDGGNAGCGGKEPYRDVPPLLLYACSR